MNQVLVSLELRRILPYYTEREKTEIEIFRMRGESIEMQTPGQVPEGAPTREERKTWCRTTCFSQTARGNNIIFKKFQYLN